MVCVSQLTCSQFRCIFIYHDVCHRLPSNVLHYLYLNELEGDMKFWRISFGELLIGTFIFCLMIFWETSQKSVLLSFPLWVEFIQIPVVTMVLKVVCFLTKCRQQGLNHCASCQGQGWDTILKNWPGNERLLIWATPAIFSTICERNLCITNALFSEIFMADILVAS